jgi:hypothetical protein
MSSALSSRVTFVTDRGLAWFLEIKRADFATTAQEKKPRNRAAIGRLGIDVPYHARGARITE